MPIRYPLLCLPVVLFLLVSCDRQSARDTVIGAWLGEGTFSTRAGAADIQAQLEILSDGSYRFLIIKPTVLAMTGMETGSWTLDADQLILQPTAEQADPEADEKGSVLQQIRRASPAKLRIKSLQVTADFSVLELSDGPMQVTFLPNDEVTKKLIESGEVDAQ